MSGLVDDLRAQMRAATQDDVAPVGLAARARDAVHRRRQRGTVLLTVAAVAGTALLAVPALAPGDAPRPPLAVQPEPDAGLDAAQAPSDAAVSRARWWGYTTEAAQPLASEDAGVAAGLYAGRLWFGADGALVHLREDGSSTTGTSTWLWELRGRKLGWDAVRALPDDVAGWREVLATPSTTGTRGALDEPAHLLRAAPLTRAQRQALVQALEQVPGVESGPGAVDARGRSGRVLVERHGDVRSAYLLDAEDRLLELRRGDGTAERVLTFSGWTTEPPPADVRPAPADLGPSDAQVARADWYGVRVGDGTDTSTSWVARTGGAAQQTGDGPVTRSEETAGWPVRDRFLTWAAVRELPGDPEQLRRALQVPSRASEAVLEDGLELLTWSPLDSGQRAALAEVLRGLDGLAVQPETADATGRAAERWELVRRNGTTLEVWWAGAGARVLQVRRSTPGAKPMTSTYSGWTTEAPPA